MRERNMRERRIQMLLILFVFGGVFGFLYEEIFYRIDLGYFVKRGTTFGPWIPIYGFGSVFIAMATHRMKDRPLGVFLASGAIAGVLEFVTGYVAYHAFHVRLWDYNTEIWNWLNIGGYVCLRSVLFFAVAGLVLRYVVQPFFEQLIEGWSKKKAYLVAGIPAAMFAGDILLSIICNAL